MLQCSLSHPCTYSSSLCPHPGRVLCPWVPRAEAVEWLLAVPGWQGAGGAPACHQQPGREGSAGQVVWGPSGPAPQAASSRLISALLGAGTGGQAQLGPGNHSWGGDSALSLAHTTPAQPCMSCKRPRRAQPGPIDPGPGAFCSALLWPCLAVPGLHGDVMFGSAPLMTA